MKRRTYSGPQPALTGGGDRPQPACAGHPEPYDVLHDLTAGPAFTRALRAARELCGSCPIAATCLRDNREEPWAKAILSPDRPTITTLPRPDVACGTESGYKRHRRRGEATCEECRRAQREGERRRAERRRKEHAA